MENHKTKYWKDIINSAATWWMGDRHRIFTDNQMNDLFLEAVETENRRRKIQKEYDELYERHQQAMEKASRWRMALEYTQKGVKRLQLMGNAIGGTGGDRITGVCQGLRSGIKAILAGETNGGQEEVPFETGPWKPEQAPCSAEPHPMQYQDPPMTATRPGGTRDERSKDLLRRLREERKYPRPQRLIMGSDIYRLLDRPGPDPIFEMGYRDGQLTLTMYDESYLQGIEQDFWAAGSDIATITKEDLE